MFHRKIIQLSIAVAVYGALASAVPAEEKLVIGTEGAYPPFNVLSPDGSLSGFDIDIGKALCAEMKVSCSFVTQEWNGMIPALQAHKFDMILASMSITDERKQVISFSRKYYNTPAAIAVPKDSPLTSVTPEALKGKKIGTQQGTTHANYAYAHMSGSTIVVYPTADEYKLGLANNQLDAAIDDIVVLSEWVKSDAGACCKLLGALPIDQQIEGEGAGIAVRKGEEALANRISAAIDAIRKNGKYQQIQKKYFDFDVWGD